MNIMMHNTNVRFPNAPTVRPIIDINKFSVGHDFANLNTRNYRRERERGGEKKSEDKEFDCHSESKIQMEMEL